MAPPEEDADEEEEEGDPDEFIDLLDVLDGKGDIDMGSDNEKPVQSKKASDEDEDEGVEDEDEDQDEVSEEDDQDKDNQDAFAPSDNEEAPEASEEFQNFISGLDTTVKKRKLDSGETVEETVKDSRSRKRRLIAERTEAGAENEFHAHASGLPFALLPY